MEKWRAICGEKYYWINCVSFNIITIRDCHTEGNDADFSTGNYFRTKKEAEKALEIIKSALVGSEVVETVADILKRVDKMAEEFIGDWEDVDSQKWFIDYSSHKKTWDCSYSCEDKGYGTKYITDDREVIDKIVEELNKAQEREGTA